MDIFLTHARLFPQQLQQFLHTLGQSVLSLLIAVVMPLLLWLGLGEPVRTKTHPDVSTQASLLNLIYVDLPTESYREVPQPAATSRQGLWERRADGKQNQLVAVVAVSKDRLDVTVLPNWDLAHLRTNVVHPYETILPHLSLPHLNLGTRQQIRNPSNFTFCPTCQSKSPPNDR